MKSVNALKKWLLNILVPSVDGIPYIDRNNRKKRDLLREQRFRDLFKKRRSALIVASFATCLAVFGIGKSFSAITGLIACSPFVVIFWSSFGEKIMGIFKLKKKKK